MAAIAAPKPAAGSLHSLRLCPAWSKPPRLDRLIPFPSAHTLLKALPRTRLAAFSCFSVTINSPPRHHLTAFPPATSLTKTKTPRRHHLTAFPLVTALSKTSPSTGLAAFPSAAYLVSSTSPNRFTAPRKPPWSLVLHHNWFPGHPSSPRRPPRASRFRPLFVPPKA